MIEPPPGTSKIGSRSGPAEHLAARTPDGSVYGDPTVFSQEMERLFFRNWLCVGRAEQVPEPGEFFTQEVGSEGLAFVRGADGTLHGFYNTCRHRGTRILTEPRGRALAAITCPYHAWSYSLDGRLVGAGHTAELTNFRKEEFGLYPVRTETWGGFVWANLDAEAAPLRTSIGGFIDRVGAIPLADLRVGGRQTYEVEANWKIVVENFSECYHCAPVHPTLNRITPYSSGENMNYFLRDGVRSKVAGGYMTFARDFTSMVSSGYTKRPPLPGATESDRHRVSYYVLFPNTFLSVHPDYLMVHRTWPHGPERSTIENEFYFHPEAMAAPDFDPTDAVSLWDEINRQDWYVCELAQKGSRSRVWHGGRYSEKEPLVHDFDRFYADQMSTPG
ncbi:MAG TPA: aromatic ring-hydroxylating dioxygenase subunit alpha [Thermoplasmata archaeon]|nr:aromatic ring-hydroxylating dioxygenase subunit alpha [Thermoplasmata archaeon]